MKKAEILSKRLAILKSNLKSSEDNILIYNEKNIFYLTGFYGKDSSSKLLLCENKNYLFVNFIFFEAAANSLCLPDTELVLVDGKTDSLAEILKKEKIKKIIFESDSVFYLEFLKIKKIADSCHINMIAVPYLFSGSRQIKDETEKQIIRQNCKLTERSLDYIKNLTCEDLHSMTETELAIEMERFLIKEGASGRAFDFIIANNEHSSKPHHVSENIKIKNGIILMDFGMHLQNYCSDITRTFFLGDLPDNQHVKKFIKIYEIVKEAQLKALDVCKEGITASELDKAARNIIKKHGYGEEFGHALGHGIGLSVHEPPFLNSANNQILMDSMVITIEPGIYIRDFGGIRIEDMVIVKKNSCERLYTDSKELFTVK